MPVKLNIASCKHNMKRTFYRRVAAAMTCFVNDIFRSPVQLGYCLPRLSSVGEDYELARRAKRVLACLCGCQAPFIQTSSATATSLQGFTIPAEEDSLYR
jgi:hypothetical protein